MKCSPLKSCPSCQSCPRLHRCASFGTHSKKSTDDETNPAACVVFLERGIVTHPVQCSGPMVSGAKSRSDGGLLCGSAFSSFLWDASEHRWRVGCVQQSDGYSAGRRIRLARHAPNPRHARPFPVRSCVQAGRVRSGLFRRRVAGICIAAEACRRRARTAEQRARMRSENGAGLPTPEGERQAATYFFFLAVGAGALPAFAAAHLAFIAAANFAFTSGAMVRFFFAGALEAAGAFAPDLILAQRAFWAATMRARPSADILPFFRLPEVGAAFAAAEAGTDRPPRIAASSCSRAAICSAIARPRFH